MSSGLSTRMMTIMQGLLPKLAALAPPADTDSATINLAAAENTLIQPQLVEFFKSTIRERLADDADSLKDVFRLEQGIGNNSSLYGSLATFFNGHFNPTYRVEPEHIVITPGAGACLEALVHSICDDGDSVLIPGPYWYVNRLMRAVGFEPFFKVRPNVDIVVANPESYQKHSAGLLSALQGAYKAVQAPSRIKALILCNPHNPFSQCYSKETLRGCIEFCQERGIHLISDEIYALATISSRRETAVPFVSMLSLAGIPNIDASRIHVVWSASKLLGSSGMKIGCLISQANPQLRIAVSLLSYGATSSPSSLYLNLLLSSAQLPMILNTNSELLTKSYELVIKRFEEWGVEFLPVSEGIFIFAKIARDARTREEENAFFGRLAKCGVIVSPGRFYNGIPSEIGWARVTFALPLDIIEEALERMAPCFGTKTLAMA